MPFFCSSEGLAVFADRHRALRPLIVLQTSTVVLANSCRIVAFCVLSIRVTSGKFEAFICIQPTLAKVDHLVRLRILVQLKGTEHSQDFRRIYEIHSEVLTASGGYPLVAVNGIALDRPTCGVTCWFE